MKLLGWLLIVCLLHCFACYYGKSLSQTLWDDTSKQYDEAYKTTFIQGLKNANLDPTSFGVYMVQDAVYVYQSKLAIDIAYKNATGELKEFLGNRSNSYGKYAQEMLKTWHIDDPSGIKLGPACENYANHLKNVAENMDPIYLVVALTPCAKLWPLLGKRLEGGDFGVYTNWTKENLDPTDDGYEKYDAMIDDANKKKQIKEKLAIDVYSKSMDGEVAFFSLDGA